MIMEVHNRFFAPCVSSVGSTAPISVRQRKHLQEEANNQNRIESEHLSGKVVQGQLTGLPHISAILFTLKKVCDHSYT